MASPQMPMLSLAQLIGGWRRAQHRKVAIDLRAVGIDDHAAALLGERGWRLMGDEFAAKNATMVHEFPGWTDELRSLQAPTLVMFGDRDNIFCAGLFK